MPQLHIDLEWGRDLDGYKLLPAEEPRSKPSPQRPSELARLIAGQATVSSVASASWTISSLAAPKPERIVRRGGQLRAYRPLREVDGMFKVFANKATTADGLLDFIEMFGPLTRSGLEIDQGEDVSILVDQAKLMGDFLERYTRLSQKGFSRAFPSRGIMLGAIESKLNVEPGTDSLRLQLSVEDLLTGLWVQFGQALSGGATLRTCRHCSMLFETGPGSGRRLDASFCSDDHRVAFNSLKRRNKDKPHA